MIRTRKKTIVPRSPVQTAYMEALARDDMIFALGPAGTGKTYLAVAQAVSKLITGSVDRLILSRPAVEAGERLGFLPGDMKEKVDPYLRPLYDALYDMLPTEQVERRIASGEIEIAPIAFMRGRTLNDAFIILDEAQNTTPQQMKMFLTRFGMRSRMVICGDPNQTDLPPANLGPRRRDGQARGHQGHRTVALHRADVVATRSSGASSRPMKDPADDARRSPSKPTRNGTVAALGRARAEPPKRRSPRAPSPAEAGRARRALRPPGGRRGGARAECEWRGKDKPTNVLSFPMAEEADLEQGTTGPN